MNIATVDRVLSEYLDMRGLRLTTAQAAKLWGLSSSQCNSVLGTLVASGDLCRDDTGQFMLAPRHRERPRTARVTRRRYPTAAPGLARATTRGACPARAG